MPYVRVFFVPFLWLGQRSASVYNSLGEGKMSTTPCISALLSSATRLSGQKYDSDRAHPPTEQHYDILRKFESPRAFSPSPPPCFPGVGSFDEILRTSGGLIFWGLCSHSVAGRASRLVPGSEPQPPDSHSGGKAKKGQKGPNSELRKKNVKIKPTKKAEEAKNFPQKDLLSIIKVNDSPSCETTHKTLRGPRKTSLRLAQTGWPWSTSQRLKLLEAAAKPLSLRVLRHPRCGKKGGAPRLVDGQAAALRPRLHPPRAVPVLHRPGHDVDGRLPRRSPPPAPN